MGQYRQWLHYREMDQQLRLRLERIEHQVAELEAEIHHLAKDSSSSTDDNIIMRALVGMYIAPAQEGFFQESSPVEPQYTVMPAEGEQIEPGNGSSAESPSWVASTLFAQSYLTNFDAFDPVTLKSLSPYADAGLLPEDLAIFFAELAQNGGNGQHDQQSASLTTSHSAIPVDKQSLRNDHLIQRWFERWGRSSDDQELQLEDQGL